MSRLARCADRAISSTRDRSQQKACIHTPMTGTEGPAPCSPCTRAERELAHREGIVPAVRSCVDQKPRRHSRRNAGVVRAGTKRRGPLGRWVSETIPAKGVDHRGKHRRAHGPRRGPRGGSTSSTAVVARIRGATSASGPSRRPPSWPDLASTPSMGRARARQRPRRKALRGRRLRKLGRGRAELHRRLGWYALGRPKRLRHQPGRRFRSRCNSHFGRYIHLGAGQSSLPDDGWISWSPSKLNCPRLGGEYQPHRLWW